MKVLHIINNGITDLSKRIIEVQAQDNEVRVIELSKKDVPYEEIIDCIFSYDKVISW